MEEFDDDSGIIFRDVTLLALSGFVAMVVMMIPFINPIAEAELETSATEPGNVIIEIHWPAELDADVDLWVKAPGDMPVGYSNKGSALVNLLRDDLGHFNDLTESNYEVTYSRGIVAGEWTVNLHAFRMDPTQAPPYVVRTVVSVMRPDFLRPVQILEKQTDLTRLGQERTVFRFKLNSQGKLIRGSTNELQRQLVINPDG
jgi:hypothetical protein